MKNIILCGFMGCGKTTVGKILAQKTGMQFVDMDKYIEEQENISVSEIFKKFGEQYFRDLEHNVCCEFADKSGYIVASGGGALTFERNVKAFKGKDKIILIGVPVEVLAERLKNDTTRPLLQRPDKEQAMKDLYDKRMPIYLNACSIAVDGVENPNAVANLIMATAGLKRKNPQKFKG